MGGTKKKPRTSGRKNTRNRTLAKQAARTPADKARSKAISARNKRILIPIRKNK